MDTEILVLTGQNFITYCGCIRDVSAIGKLRNSNAWWWFRTFIWS